MPLDEDIDLYTFTDYREYLKAWLAARKSRSYQYLAGQIGCSKSLIAAIVQGKRPLQTHWIPSLLDALGLAEERDRAYFTALVDLAEAPELARRRAGWGLVLSMQRFRGTNLVGQAAYKLYSRWYHIAIVNLARCKAFREDPAWLAATLRPTITPEQAAEALETLQELGLLQRDASGKLVFGSWTSGHEVQNQVVAAALTELYPDLFSLAAQAIETVPPNERQFEFLAFPMPKSRLSEFRELVRQFQEGLLHLAASTQEPGDRVYLASVQLFPLSDPREP